MGRTIEAITYVKKGTRKPLGNIKVVVGDLYPYDWYVARSIARRLKMGICILLYKGFCIHDGLYYARYSLDLGKRGPGKKDMPEPTERVYFEILSNYNSRFGPF